MWTITIRDKTEGSPEPQKWTTIAAVSEDDVGEALANFLHSELTCTGIRAEWTQDHACPVCGPKTDPNEEWGCDDDEVFRDAPAHPSCSTCGAPTGATCHDPLGR